MHIWNIFFKVEDDSRWTSLRRLRRSERDSSRESGIAPRAVASGGAGVVDGLSTNTTSRGEKYMASIFKETREG